MNIGNSTPSVLSVWDVVEEIKVSRVDPPPNWIIVDGFVSGWVFEDLALTSAVRETILSDQSEFTTHLRRLADIGTRHERSQGGNSFFHAVSEWVEALIKFLGRKKFIACHQPPRNDTSMRSVLNTFVTNFSPHWAFPPDVVITARNCDAWCTSPLVF